MNPRVEAEHEMSRVPSVSTAPKLSTGTNHSRSRGSHTTLTNNYVTHANASSLKGQKPTKTHDRFGLLRQFRLQSFACIATLFKSTGCNANTEYRKVALHHNRALAAAYSLLHLVPLTVAITLVILQWTSPLVSYWDDYSTALQFAAKIHELAMQASLIEVLLCLIRTRLVDDLVPLGALTCVMQATQLSYLWSLDFFSIFRSQALKGWRRAMLIVAIPVIVSLMSVVGPSSAALMIPRPNSPSIAPRTLAYPKISADTMHPSQINLAERLTLYVCKHYIAFHTHHTIGIFLEPKKSCRTLIMVVSYP